jgi:hypothetical protein
MAAQWGECAPFMADAFSEGTSPPDVMIFDTNYHYE